MERIDILDKLVELSYEHIRLFADEKWDEWEKIAQIKIELYDILINKCGSSLCTREEILLSDVNKLEKKIIELIREKRDDTKEELKSVAGIKNAIKGYKMSNSHRNNRSHIRFEI